MGKTVFVNDCLCHVFNRGVEKRIIFLDGKDYRRFLFGMKEFNDKNSTINILRRINKSEGHPMSLKPENKEALVEIICYCLMPNHFHFILKQLKESGISKFMQKLGIGYTKYFNQKYERSGVLFQGKFKNILIERDNYLNYLRQYIHLNPLELVESTWQEEGIKNFKRVKEFLENYRWTDCRNYERYLENFEKQGSEYFSKIKELKLNLD